MQGDKAACDCQNEPLSVTLGQLLTLLTHEQSNLWLEVPIVAIS